MGQGAFVDVSGARLPTTPDASYDFATGDVDGDGDPDVVIANAGQSRLLLNDGQGHFNDVTTSHLPVLAVTAMAAALGDVDGDGDLDLILANAKGQSLLLRNDGQGHFADVTPSRLPLQSDVSMRVQLGDVDGDGDLDLVIANRGSRNRLWRNDGTGVFTDVTATHLPDDNALSSDVELADVDGNGTLDLVVANQQGPNRLLRNNGLGVFSDVTVGHLPDMQGDTIDLLVTDIDADGDLDLLVTEGTTPLRLLLNDGSGTFVEVTTTHLPALDAFGIKVIAGDVDHDGDADLVLAAAGQDRLLLNDGTGHFSDATDSLLPVDTQRTFGAVLLDIDRDLDLDLLLATPGAANRLLLNDLTIPRLLVSVTPARPEVGEAVTIAVEAFDEASLASARLTLTDPNGNTQEADLGTDLADGHAAFAFTAIVPGVYTTVIVVVDTQGERNSRLASFTVRPKDIIAPQVALAVPTSLLVGQTASLHVTTADEQGVVSTNVTVNAVSIPLTDDGTAILTPTSAGPHLVVARATDAAGNEGTAEATITVSPDTVFPLVSLSVTPGTTALTHPVSISVTATDNVAVTSRSLRVTGPAIPEGLEVAIDTAGHAVYTPFHPGTYIIVATAHDPSGNTGSAAATFDATGQPDATPPLVSLTVTPLTVAVGSAVTLAVTATDDVGVSTVTIEVNDTPLPLSATGMATYTPSITGEYAVIAVARDATQNTGSASATFRAIDPGQNTEAPVVNLTSPASHTTITAPTEIIGTVRDATLVRYTLAYAPRGTNRFTTFATGTSEIQEGVLGSLDPSLLMNDLYDIRLSAEDMYGRTSVITAVYQVTGQLKVGHVTLAFQDLVIPVVGLPITITRTYDSRAPTPGDFGMGWRLDIQAVTLRESRPLGSGWPQSSSQSGFVHVYCLEPGDAYVTITLPNGRQESFDLFPVTPAESRTSTTFGDLPEYCQFFAPIQVATATFRPRPGTQTQLEALTDNALWVVGDQLLHTGPSGDFDLYTPTRYRLTTPEGIILDLDKSFGVRSVTEPHGHTLTFTRDGILHSAGKSVTFTRDAADRITQITDPNGNIITYTYDATGALVTMTDQEGHSTRYTYDTTDTTHRLAAIEDPRGITVARNMYDDTGRLIAHIDADGHRIDYTHDLDGRQEIVRDRLGYITVYTYDDAGNILSQTDPSGQTTTWTYDAAGYQLSDTDPLGQTTTYTRDHRGNALTETDALGHTTTYTYNARNQLLTVTDPLGHITTNTYDVRGNLLTTTDALGHTTTHTYDLRGNLQAITDPLGHSTTFAYDTAGNLLTLRQAHGHATSFTYDANGNVLTATTTQTDAQGQAVPMVTTYAYDGANRLIQTTDPFGQVETTVYNALGKVAAHIDAHGQRTAYAYDMFGNLMATTFPDGTTETATYDASGYPLSETDRAGRTMQYVYDALGQRLRTIYADGTGTRTNYDAAGRVIAAIDEREQRTTFAYDAAGHLTRIIDALGYGTTFIYNPNGQPISWTDANGYTTRYVYDARGQRTQTIFPDGTLAEVIYDALRRKIAVTDQAGQTAHFTYDAVGRLTQVTDALGQTTRFTYDAAGNKLTQTDAHDHTTLWAYDRGRMVSRTLPLGMAEYFTYDAHGHLLSHTDFNGQTRAFAYDSEGRLTQTTLPDGTQIASTYTPTGQRATITDARGTTTYHYDLHDRLRAVIHPDGTTLTYAYDATGNRSAVTTPAGTTIATHDALGRLQTVTAPAGGVTTYTYDTVGNRTSVTFPNGTSAFSTYDALNRLTRLEHVWSDNSTFARYTYTLGPVGHRRRVTEHTGRQVDYAYDALYRLIAETIAEPGLASHTIAYAYDAVGNRLTKTEPSGTTVYSYDANDRLLTAGEATYSYDANGNLVRHSTGGGETTTYTYDAGNRLVTVTTPDRVVEYAYDADGNRVRTTVNGVATDYMVDTNRDFAQVVAAYDAAGTLLAHYVYGDDLLSQEGAGSTVYYHTDGLGSTRILTDDSETITDTYAYDAFGTLLSSTGATANPYRFAGEQYDPHVDGYYLRARYYASSSGRFLNMDSHPGRSTQPLTLHRYLYAGADPVNNRDPSGLAFSIADILSAQQAENFLQRALHSIIRPIQIIEKVRKIADIYNTVKGVYDIAANSTDIFKIFQEIAKSSGREAGFHNALSDWDDAVLAFGAGIPEAIGHILTTGKLGDIQKLFASKRNKIAFLLYMPTPYALNFRKFFKQGLGGLEIIVPTGIKIGPDNWPLKLSFTPGRGGGRLLGIGILPDKNKKGEANQVYRMDWHERHQTQNGPTRHDYWEWSYPRSPYHYHVPR